MKKKREKFGNRHDFYKIVADYVIKHGDDFNELTKSDKK